MKSEKSLHQLIEEQQAKHQRQMAKLVAKQQAERKALIEKQDAEREEMRLEYMHQQFIKRHPEFDK